MKKLLGKTDISFLVEGYLSPRLFNPKLMGLKFMFVKFGVKGLGLKLGVEKSGVEMSFNWQNMLFHLITLSFLYTVRAPL